MQAIKLFQGVSIFPVNNSQYWQVRVWNRETKRYVTKSTGATNEIDARKFGQRFALSLLQSQPVVDPQFSFRHFAIKCMSRNVASVAAAELSDGHARTLKWAIENDEFGLMKRFGHRDIRAIRTHDFLSYIEHLKKTRPDLSASTKGTITAAFRNILKVARDEGAIDSIPDTPRSKQHDNPRPFFRFYPLVERSDDLSKKIQETAKTIAQEGLIVRGVLVTDELYDLIMFVLHSFVRPVVTELYSIRHSDVTIVANPKSLNLIIRNGKTGFRQVNTMPAAVSVYQRIKKRHPDASGQQYIFLPHYENRETASKIIQRQFHEVLKRAQLDQDPTTGKKYTIYSLRHTAICMRLVNSKGQVNIYTLAKTCGTSVAQIERFYARNLELSPFFPSKKKEKEQRHFGLLLSKND
jgi:hypothetical protein